MNSVKGERRVEDTDVKHEALKDDACFETIKVTVGQWFCYGYMSY